MNADNTDPNSLREKMPGAVFEVSNTLEPDSSRRCWTVPSGIRAFGVAALPLRLRFETELEDRDRIVAFFGFVLDVSHVEQFVADQDSGGDAVEVAMAALEDVETGNGAKIRAQLQADDARRDGAVLDGDQRSFVEI